MIVGIMNQNLHNFRQRVQQELSQNILPFWINLIDQENGGFYGEVGSDGVPDPHAAKGGILTARILWTFSHAYRLFGNPDYLRAASQAFRFLSDHFWDPDFGGTYWHVDYRGSVLEPKKQIYAQGFSIYGLSEYFLATQNQQALKQAIRIFELIEQHAFDPRHAGYFEAFYRDWSMAKDFRLSDKEQNDPKTMNTHLHLLEPYTNLLRAWDDPYLRHQQRSLIRTFLDHIIDHRTHHFGLFFNQTWQSRTPTLSYGHDIEGSWLLTEAAGVLGEAALRHEVSQAAIQIAQAVFNEALDTDGAIFYEAEPDGKLHDFKEWWAEAEAVVGFYNAYQLTGDDKFLLASIRAWQFIENFLVDKSHGEWYRTVNRQGAPILGKLVDFWKCPYHNGRACMEIWERTSDRLDGSPNSGVL
jgi:mannobiose 2-epimerase